MRMVGLGVVALLGCEACTLDLTGVPVRSRRAADLDAGQRDAGSVFADSGGNEQGPKGKGDAGDDDTSDETEVPDSGMERAPPQHATCAVALPADLREDLQVEVGPTGRPIFDLYRDISCDQAASHPTCSNSSECEDGFCAIGGAQQIGYCRPDTSTPLSPTTFDSGACLDWLPLPARKKACCDEVPGVDCRPWPFETKSGPRLLCATQKDCELGLVCKQYAPSSIAVCVCPDLDPYDFIKGC